MSQTLDPQKAITYSSYLEVDALLNLQRPESSEHDELLFIIIHQVYELWFKQLLHELDFLKTCLDSADLPRAHYTLKRMLSILKTVVSQVDILETMTPLEFNGFRDRLGSSSGFQSYQFRELEFALGYKRPKLMSYHPEGSEGRRRLETRYQSLSLWQHFLAMLSRHGYKLPPALLADPLASHEANLEVQVVLIEIYRHNPTLSALCERLLDLDEGIQEWRYRHVKMVERTIGYKMGTGGSSGVDYLKQTLTPLFPDLWQIRNKL
ncbi:MAG: tryptophan 2,3-dioxygenase family protein [Deinococcales bacterium]